MNYATEAQVRLLSKFGYPENVSRQYTKGIASEIISKLLKTAKDRYELVKTFEKRYSEDNTSENLIRDAILDKKHNTCTSKFGDIILDALKNK